MAEQQAQNNRLQYFPVAFFSMVMGLCGLTIAWGKASHLWPSVPHIAPWLLSFTAAVFVILLSFYISKALAYPAAIKAELAHPIKLNFFAAISISLLLLAVASLPLLPGVAEVLWLLGAGLHLAITLMVISSWMHHQHYQIQHMNPAWFIPAVGNILVPVAGVALGYTEISWMFFSIGTLFWIVLLTILFYRIIFHTPLDERMMPTLFILIAPPAVGFLAYLRLTDHLDAYARMLYFSGLFFTLLLMVQFKRFVRLNFSLSWWAYSFPLAAITLATMAMHERTGAGFYLALSATLLGLLSSMLTLLMLRTLIAISRKKICVEGH